MSTNRDIGTSGMAAAILNFWFPVVPYSVLITSVELLGYENGGLAVGIVLLFRSQAELCDFTVYRPPSWIFAFWVRDPHVKKILILFFFNTYSPKIPNQL